MKKRITKREECQKYNNTLVEIARSINKKIAVSPEGEEVAEKFNELLNECLEACYDYADKLSDALYDHITFTQFNLLEKLLDIEHHPKPITFLVADHFFQTVDECLKILNDKAEKEKDSGLIDEMIEKLKKDKE